MHCVSSSSLKILWNGKRMPSFSPNRGLSQGDPLFPYLFVICMEKLSLAINDAVVRQEWISIKISKNGPGVSYLFFADDMLLFSKARNSQFPLIASMFDNFNKASSLKDNLSKYRACFFPGVASVGYFILYQKFKLVF